MNKHLLKERTDVTESVIRKRLEKVILRSHRNSDIRKAVFLIVFIWLLFHLVFGFLANSGNIMQPSIQDGDLLLYYRLYRNYASEDAVVFEDDGELYIGRIAAMPGDEVLFTEDGRLVINGYTQVEAEGDIPYVVSFESVSYPLTLGKDEYFVLTDEKTTILDSRSFGAIAKKDIKGKIITILRRRNI